jgi:uncharacterized lipoprotein YbaY
MTKFHTKKEVRNYDISKGVVIALLLLSLLFLELSDQSSNADTMESDEIAGMTLTAPELSSPEPGAQVEPGIVRFSGTGVPMSMVALLVDGSQVDETAVSESGSWQMEAELASGERSIELQTLDSDSNVAATAPSFTINVIESIEEINIDTPAENLIAGLIAISGTGQPGYEVAVNVDDEDAGTAPIADDGNWRMEIAVTEGSHVVRAQQLTPDGEEAGSATEIQVSVSEVAPPTIDSPLEVLVAGENLLTGTGTPGTTVIVYAAGITIGEAEVNDQGEWEVPVNIEAGEYEITISTVRSDGTETETEPSGSIMVSSDRESPTLNLPDISLPSFNPLSGLYLFSGTAEPGSKLGIYANDELVGETESDEEGNWQFELPELNLPELNLSIANLGEDNMPEGEAATTSLGLRASLPTFRLPWFALDGAAPDDEDLELSVPRGNINWRGSAEPGSEVAVVIDDEVAGEATANENGRFNINLPLEPGSYNLQLGLFGEDGALSNLSEILPLNVSDSETVTGSVTYLQRSALPDDATVTVQIRDTSLADAPALVVGEQVIPTEGNQVPFEFAVPYDPDDIIENHNYSMSARITDGDGNLLFINDTNIPVLTNGNPTEGVEIVTVPVQTSVEGDANISGTVTYLQRIALPDDTVVEVSLQDISTPGSIAEVIGEQIIVTDGAQVPIPYEVSYDPAEIVDNHTYAVRARIEDSNGNLLFTSDTVTPVITNDNPTEDVEILTVPVAQDEPDDVEFDEEAETVEEATNVENTFSTLRDGLEVAGLLDRLSDPDGSYTLFAPTDTVFDMLPEEVIEAWNANPESYGEIMSYLVVEGNYLPEDLENGQVLDTLAGTRLNITKLGDDIYVNGVPTSGNIEAGNSVVYALNRLILPPLDVNVQAPIIDEEGVPVFKGPLLTVVGLGEPGKRILLQVDGENFGEIALIDEENFWLTMEDIPPGLHFILAYMLDDDDTLMAISQLVVLPVPEY